MPLYTNPCCALSHLFVPLWVLTLRTCMYTYIQKWFTWLYVYIYIYRIKDSFVHKYTYLILQILLYMTPCCANSHLFVPLRVLTLWTSLHTYYRTHILTSIRLAYNRYSCIWTPVLRTHVCLCPGECSHSEPLCIHAYTHKYTHIVLQILLYMTPCCANSHMFVPLRALTHRTSLHIFTCILYIYIYIFMLNLVLGHTVWFFHFFQSHTEHFFLSEWRLEFASIAERERLNWNDNRLCWLRKIVCANLTVGWCGSHSKNLWHRKGSKCEGFFWGFHVWGVNIL